MNKISAIFFSPTDTTKNVISIMAQSLPLPINMIDITSHNQNANTCKFAQDELVIFGVPVYGGRVPEPAITKISKVTGNKTHAVIVTTYGNRHYDDAILELKTLVEQNGFIVIAAAAVVTEHSIMHSVAHGRPDQTDTASIGDFTRKMWQKAQSDDAQSVSVSGHSPYREYGGVPLKPHSTSACTKCGICSANCPVSAIPADDPSKTNKDTCISCMRCIKGCHFHARKLSKPILAVAEMSFAKKCAERREMEIFI